VLNSPPFHTGLAAFTFFQEQEIPRSALAEATASLAVLLAGWAEDVQNQGAGRSGTEAVRHAAWGAPEIALIDGNLVIVLDADTISLQQHAPLLLIVAVHAALGAWFHAHHGEHGLIPNEDSCVETRSKLTLDTLLQVMELEEIFLLIHVRTFSIEF